MSSAEPTSRRRPRSDIEDDDDADDVRSSQNSSPSRSGNKRARTNGHRSDSEIESPEPEASRMNSIPERYDDDVDDDESSDGEGKSEFQPGSIRRVKLTNFVTYEKAEFFPGPNLNMVIGPNGTGKSSLVCAICLGLGLGPKHLGRAGEVGEFVKHNMSEAEIEIELEHLPEHRNKGNYIVRVRIIRDGNQREWYLNGKKSTLKAVQELTRLLSIQIDNLCQFLPQDKVAEFAALSPVELLLQTQRAAAPEKMLNQHELLKKQRDEQRTLEVERAREQEHLESMENRQQNLEIEVRRLQERNDIQRKVVILKKRIPFIEYKAARLAHLVFKKKKTEAQARLKGLTERVEPILATVHSKEADRDLIATVVREREQILKHTEQEAKVLVDKLDAIDVEIKETEGSCAGEISNDNTRKIALRKIQQLITTLEARLKEAPIDFNASEWNTRIAKLNQEVREAENRLREAKSKNEELNAAARLKQKELADTKLELDQFNSAEGQLNTKLDSVSKDTAEGWKWVQAHQKEFIKEVYGPPLVSCSVKDPMLVNAVESLFQLSDICAFTAQTPEDWQKLMNELIIGNKLAEITLRQSSTPLSTFQKPRISDADMRRYGFDGWALDLLDGPEPVLAMLSSKLRLNVTAIGKHETNNEQHSLIMESGINSWITGEHLNTVVRRREYGPSAVTTTCKPIRPAKWWTDSPIDVSKREEIQSRITALQKTLDQMFKDILPIRAERESATKNLELKKEQETTAKNEKNSQQKLYNQQMAIPAKIEAEKENEAAKKMEALAVRQRLATLFALHDTLVVRKARVALDHNNVVTQLRRCHEELLEAKIRLIETESDITSLNERNRDITEQVTREEALVKSVEAESKRVKAVAARALAVCEEIRQEADFGSFADEMRKNEEGITVEILEQEIAAEESKLEFIHASNPNAIRDFEARQKDVEKLTGKLAQTDARIAHLERSINKVRGKWEPKLDDLIAKISEAFSFNFEQIGCAGEVSVHKDEDFEKWAIRIKVKFREHEKLEILDQHRQSGGERSVSTIFYLMSLQSMARAPFRVVDEINQGMDPRNERMVHERMVEIACKEHTSQYFLITPKLLTGLRYDKRMKVLCIASGEHMPENYQRLDIARIISIQRAVIASG